MTESQGRQVLLATFLAAIATLTWTEMHLYQTMPRPARYVGAGLTWGILGLLAPVITYRLAALFGAGLYLTLLYQYFNAGGNQVLVQGLRPISPGAGPPVSQPQQTKGV